MNELQIFQNPSFGNIRAVNKDGEPWFVAKDVCDCLELSNPSMSVSRLDADERAKLNLGRQGAANIVNEYGLYSLILCSRKPEAKQFKRWVTHDVIPAIRKTGGYSKPEYSIPQTFAEALQLAADQTKKLEEQAPKVLFADAVEASKKSCLIGELAKMLRQNGVEIGQNRLFSWMRKNGYLCQYGERYNQPTQRSMEMKLMEIKKTAINKPDGTILTTLTTKITPHGQIYFINKFLAKPGTPAFIPAPVPVPAQIGN